MPSFTFTTPSGFSNVAFILQCRYLYIALDAVACLTNTWEAGPQAEQWGIGRDQGDQFPTEAAYQKKLVPTAHYWVL